MSSYFKLSKFFARVNWFHLQIIVLLFSAVLPARAQDSISHLTAQLHDAQRLTRSASELASSSSNLKHDADRLLAAYSGSVSENEPSQYDQLKRYSELLAAYHQALHNYLQHRQEVQQHATEFHQQVQDNKILDSPLVVPAFKALKMQAQDACMQMNIQERQLVFGEMQLRDAIETLTAQRQHLLPADFDKQWAAAVRMAASLRSANQTFEATLGDKQASTSSTLDNQVHLAFISGDYVEAQQTFSNVNQHSAIISQEVQRAAMHHSIVRQFIMRLTALDPNQPAASQSGCSDNFAADPDAIPDADNELATEYQHVEDLYSEVQKAQPKR